MSAAKVASPGLDGPGGAGDLRLGSPLPGQAKQGSEHTGTALRGQGSASPPPAGGPCGGGGLPSHFFVGPSEQQLLQSCERVASGHSSSSFRINYWC